MTNFKRCPKCGEVKERAEFSRNRRAKDGLQSYCKPCHRAGVMAAYYKNPELTKQRVRAWEKANPEKIRKKREREKLLSRWKWERRREARFNRQERAVRKRFKTQHRTRAWKTANPERWAWLERIGNANFIARRHGVPGRLTVDAVLARFAFFGNCCYLCGGSPETIDHVIPMSKGGPNWPSNIRPACDRCNKSKGNRPLDAIAS